MEFGLLIGVQLLRDVLSSNDFDEFSDVPDASSEAATEALNAETATNKVSIQDMVNKFIREFPEKKHEYVMEMVCIAFVLVWIVTYFVGKAKNRSLAVKWVNEYKELFASQFEVISAGSTAAPNADELLSQESPNNFLFFASGRQYCCGMLVDIMLKRRQDIIMYIYDMLFAVRDTVSFQIPLDPTKIDADALMFAICAKGKHTVFRDNNKLIQEFTSTVHPADFPERLVTICESSECARELLSNANHLNMLREKSDLIELIYTTDLNKASIIGFRGVQPRILLCSYRLTDNPKDMRDLVEFTLELIDIVAKLKLSGTSKNKVDKNRKQIAEREAKKALKATMEQRQEELNRQKAAKAEKERLEYEALSDKEKLKRDLQEEKKKKKESMGKMKVKRG